MVEAVWPFLQTYGLWIVIDGVFVYMMSRGTGCCATSQPGGACDTGSSAAGSGQEPGGQEAADRAGRPATVGDLRARLAELQTQQALLARQIATLEVEPSGTNHNGHRPVVLGGVGPEDRAKSER